jgi:hypothetical protein
MMSQLNPLTGSIMQTPQVQRDLAADKSRQLRQAEAIRKNGADQEDQDEPHVRSAEELEPVSDRHTDGHPRRKNKSPHKSDPAAPDDAPGLDLKA